MEHSADEAKQPLEPTLRLEQQLCFALYSASLAMTRLYQSRLKPMGLTYPQYVVMVALWERDCVTVSEVGQRVQLDSGTLSQLLKRLEKGGFLHRERDAGRDERRVLISLTTQGRELESSLACLPGDMMSSLGISHSLLTDLTVGVSALRRKILLALPGKD